MDTCQRRKHTRGGARGITTTRFRLDRPMAVLLGSLLLVMVGYGSTLTVLPDHIQRVGVLGGAAGSVAFHVGAITGVYALAGLVASPIVGRLGDRRGRRPVLLASLGGLAATQILFALSSSLWMLYLLRVLGGFADASLLVTASAYIADKTSNGDRARGMAWFGTAVSLGLVAGPALTAPLSGLNLGVGGGNTYLEGHAIPFVVTGLLAASALAILGPHLPDSAPARRSAQVRSQSHQAGLRSAVTATAPLLLLVFAAQYGLAVFEGVFVLYARDRFSLTLAQIGLAFMVCNAVIAVQLPVVDWLTARMPAFTQVAVGFGIMGVSLAGLLVARSFPLVLTLAALHGAGGAVVIPNLTALVSTATQAGVGLALGLKNTASSLGQFLGPFIGGTLMGLHSGLPFLLAGAVLIGVAVTAHRALGSGNQLTSRRRPAPTGDRKRAPRLHLAQPGRVPRGPVAAGLSRSE